MAVTITGTGTKLDPYVCYTWKDFESLAYIVDIDHEATNTYTLELPKTGLTPIPQTQPNIYIKFADYKEDPDDPDCPGVLVKEVDFEDSCIPNTIMFKNVAQIDFNGWVFKNIRVSYWQDKLNGPPWEVQNSICVGNSIIIQNLIYDTSEEPAIPPLNYIKLLNGRFIINEDWIALKELDEKDKADYDWLRHDTYSHNPGTSTDFLRDEITFHSADDLGGDLYKRCFPLFFLHTGRRYYKAFFDRCDFIIYQSGETAMRSAIVYSEQCLFDDGYIFVQHTPNYEIQGADFIIYPEAAYYAPGAALFVYCNIYFYNDHGVPMWSTDTNFYFLNSKIKLFGSADNDDIERLKVRVYDPVEQKYVYKLLWEWHDMVNLCRAWESCVFNYCDLDVIINLPRKVWLKNIRMFAPIYNSSLNINCPNTDNFMFTGRSQGSAYYSGVYTHAYPMKFTAQDSTIQNARKIIDITGVRVENYSELLENPDYVLGNTNIPEDYFRIYEQQSGDAINSMYIYLGLRRDFRYSKYIRNGLPFVPMYDFPKIEGFDINRAIQAEFNQEVPVRVIFDDLDITSMWTQNNDNGIHWQKEYNPILQSQLYGNWFNNTEQWGNERKTIETSYVFLNHEEDIQNTVVTYKLKEYSYINPISGELCIYHLPEIVTKFNTAEYQDNNWLPLETYKHAPENLTGIEITNNINDLDKCIWFEINKTMLNQFNWCIVIASMTDYYNKYNDNYLFYMPLEDEFGNTQVYYIKQSLYFDDRLQDYAYGYETNITSEQQPGFKIIRANPDLYDGCHIFAINCYGILLELFVDGEFFDSVNITTYMKTDEPFKQNATIGKFNIDVDVEAPDGITYTVENGFVGAFLGIHMFADYCSWSDIWNIYSEYGIKFFRKGVTPSFEPELTEINVANVPTKLDVLEGDTISYSDFVIYGQYSDGTKEIHNELTYSIPDGSTASNVGEQTVTITCADLPDWSYTFTLNVKASYVIRITLLDENFDDTNTYYDCTTSAEAKSYLQNADANNRYKLEISERFEGSTIYKNTFDNTNAINQCPTLHSIYLPNKITELTSYCFATCVNLKEVHFGNASTISVTGTSFAFCGFETLTIPSNVVLGGECFKGCANLTTVIFNNSAIGGFRECTSLSTIMFTNDVNVIYSDAFRDCTALTSIDLSMVIGTINNSFYNCTNLETVTLSSHLKYINDNAFYGTKLLSDFNNSEDEYLIINDYLVAMKPNTNTTIAIPNTVRGIAYDMINNTTAPNITTLRLPNALEYLSSHAINKTVDTLEIYNIVDAPYNTLSGTYTNLYIGKDFSYVPSSGSNAVWLNMLCTNVYLDVDNVTYSLVDNILYSHDKTILYKVFNDSQSVITVDSHTTTIEQYAFYNLTIDELYIPETTTTIKSQSSSATTFNYVEIDNVYGEVDTSEINSCITNHNLIFTKSIRVQRFSSINGVTPDETTYYSVFNDAITYLKASAQSTYFCDVVIPSKFEMITSDYFYNCTRLRSLDMRNTATVALSYNFAYGCSNLKYVKLPEGITSLPSGGFGNCTILETVIFPSTIITVNPSVFNNSGIVKADGQDIRTPIIVDGWLIKWLDATGDIVIPNDAKCIASAVFDNRTTLTTVDLNNVEMIDDVCFRNCTNLTSITFGDKLKTIGATPITGVPATSNYVFYGCSSLQQFIVSNDNPYYASEFDVLYNKIKTKLVKVPQAITHSVTVNSNCLAIGDLACSDITNTALTITVPNNVDTLGIGAFYNCTASVTMSTSIISFGNSCFMGCTSLQAITINTNASIEGTTNIFRNCTSLTSVTLPNDLVKVPNYCFYGCTALTSIDIPNTTTELMTSVFQNCTNLATINMPSVTAFGSNCIAGTAYLNNLKQLDDIVIINGTIVDTSQCTGDIVIPNTALRMASSCFKNNTNITSVELPNTITIISTYCFQGCSNLTTITFGNAVTEFGSYAFQNCSSLTFTTLPNTLTYIGSNAFDGCSSITSITIPSGVTVLRSQTFQKCNHLEQLTLNEGLIELQQIFTNYSSSPSTYQCIITSITIPSTVTTVNKSCFNHSYINTLETIYINQNQSESSLDPSTWTNCTATIVWTG